MKHNKHIILFEQLKAQWFYMNYNAKKPNFCLMDEPRFNRPFNFVVAGTCAMTANATRELRKFFERTFGWNPRSRPRVLSSRDFLTDGLILDEYWIHYNHHDLAWKCPRCMNKRHKLHAHRSTEAENVALPIRKSPFDSDYGTYVTVNKFGPVGSKRQEHNEKSLVTFSERMHSYVDNST